MLLSTNKRDIAEGVGAHGTLYTP